MVLCPGFDPQKPDHRLPVRKHDPGIAFLFVSTIPASCAPAEATPAPGRKAFLNQGVAAAWRLSEQALAEEPGICGRPRISR
jgi:hypothetical protein